MLCYFDKLGNNIALPWLLGQSICPFATLTHGLCTCLICLQYSIASSVRKLCVFAVSTNIEYGLLLIILCLCYAGSTNNIDEFDFNLLNLFINLFVIPPCLKLCLLPPIRSRSVAVT